MQWNTMQMFWYRPSATRVKFLGGQNQRGFIGQQDGYLLTRTSIFKEILVTFKSCILCLIVVYCVYTTL